MKECKEIVFYEVNPDDISYRGFKERKCFHTIQELKPRITNITKVAKIILNSKDELRCFHAICFNGFNELMMKDIDDTSLLITDGTDVRFCRDCNHAGTMQRFLRLFPAYERSFWNWAKTFNINFSEAENTSKSNSVN